MGDNNFKILRSRLVEAALQARSCAMKFGAIAYDDRDRILSAGWNGRPDESDMAAVAVLATWLQQVAEGRGLDPATVNLVPGKGFRRTMHAEGRVLTNLVKETGRVEDVQRISRVEIAAVIPNGKYFGIKKMEKDARELWATCRHCARLFDLAGTHGEMMTATEPEDIPVWTVVDPRKAFRSATQGRIVPPNFWDSEKDSVMSVLRTNRKNPPLVIETDFMIWRSLEFKI